MGINSAQSINIQPEIVKVAEKIGRPEQPPLNQNQKIGSKIEDEKKATGGKGERENVEDTPKKGIQKDGLEKTVATINKFLETLEKKRVEFAVDERLKGGLVVKVVDKETEEVIKQYPPEELLDIMARIEDAILGILLDKKV